MEQHPATIETPAGSIELPARLLTIRQLEERHPALAGSLRRCVRLAELGVREYEALCPAIYRIAGHVYVDEAPFSEWLRLHASKPRAQRRGGESRGRR